MQYRKLSFAILAVVGLSLASADAAQPETLALGSKPPAFTLKDVNGKLHSLKDYQQAKVLAVVFTCNHCPTAQAYETRLKQLRKDYDKQQLALVAISPNDPKAVRLDELGYTDLNDSFEEMKVRAREKQFNFPYLYNGEKQDVAKAYGPVATPHVFVFGPERKLRYEGAVDDQENPEKTETHFARNAIDALLEDKAVPKKQSNVFGCSIKWSDKREKAKRFRKRWNQEEATLEKVDAAAVKKLTANDTEKMRLINVWATWCAPCVAELPQFTEMHRMYRKRPFELITISMDQLDERDKALKMLNKHHLSASNYIFSGDDRDQLVEAIGAEWRGPVPFTVLIAPGGELVYRHQGPINEHELKKAIADQIGRTYFAN
jgi:peroxiredoxin